MFVYFQFCLSIYQNENYYEEQVFQMALVVGERLSIDDEQNSFRIGRLGRQVHVRASRRPRAHAHSSVVMTGVFRSAHPFKSFRARAASHPPHHLSSNHSSPITYHLSPSTKVTLSSPICHLTYSLLLTIEIPFFKGLKWGNYISKLQIAPPFSW